MVCPSQVEHARSAFTELSLELQKLGPTTRGSLFIQLATFPYHYLVLVITDEEFRYALISVKERRDSMYTELIMEDIGWLDVKRIHGDDAVVKHRSGLDTLGPGGKKRKPSMFESDGNEMGSNALGQQRASARSALALFILESLIA